MTNHSFSVTDSELTEHEQLMSQLPWLANGTLDEREETLMRAHLNECSICREEYASISSMITVAKSEAERSASMGMDANASLAMMKNRIAKDSQRQGESLLYRTKTWLNHYLGENLVNTTFNSLFKNTKPVVAFASVSIIALSLLVLKPYLVNPDTPAEYQVLSNQEQVSGIKFAVTFDEALSQQESTNILSTIAQQTGLQTHLLEQNRQRLTFVATGGESETDQLPQNVSNMMELLKNRADVVDVQLLP